MVKRIRLLVLLGAVALALPLGFLQGVAGATGGGGTQVSIQQYADYNLAGAQLDVGLYVRCSGGSGVAQVTVTQESPETGTPTTGTGFNPAVVCDGRTHSVGVSLIGSLFDPGRAKAKADVTSLGGGSAHAERWITILVV
jgi:hypothetical protein